MWNISYVRSFLNAAQLYLRLGFLIYLSCKHWFFTGLWGRPHFKTRYIKKKIVIRKNVQILCFLLIFAIVFLFFLFPFALPFPFLLFCLSFPLHFPFIVAFLFLYHYLFTIAFLFHSCFAFPWQFSSKLPFVHMCCVWACVCVSVLRL